MRAAILLPAVFAALGAEGLFFAIADGANTVRRYACLDQRSLRGVRAVVAQRQVVLGGTTLVAMSLDGELDRGVRLQEVGIRRNGRLIAGAKVVFIIIKEDVLHVTSEGLLVRLGGSRS